MKVILDERRAWEKFGDVTGPGITNELESVSWIPSTFSEVKEETVIKPVKKSLVCRKCGGSHLTITCKLEIEEKSVMPAIIKKEPTIIMGIKCSKCYGPHFTKDCNLNINNEVTFRVSNLTIDVDVNREELYNFFSQFGKLKDGRKGVRMIREKKKKQEDNYDDLPFLGYAYVTFEDKGETAYILDKMKGKKHRHCIIECELAKSK